VRSNEKASIKIKRQTPTKGKTSKQTKGTTKATADTQRQGGTNKTQAKEHKTKNEQTKHPEKKQT
jgi:hypothetical protein